MSIEIVVGVFADRAQNEDDPLGFYADYDRGFEAINALLRSLGLPEHHEPISLAGPAFCRTVTSELYPFKGFAWDIERQTTLRFPHLLELGGTTICLPLLFEEVLELPPPFTSDIRHCGSSYKLCEECRLLAEILGIFSQIEDETGASRVEQCSQDSVIPMVERMLDLDQEEGEIPFSLLRNLLLDRYPLLSENPWAVIGTGACPKLYEAAKFSARHKAALVISA